MKLIPMTRLTAFTAWRMDVLSSWCLSYYCSLSLFIFHRDAASIYVTHYGTLRLLLGGAAF